MAQNTGMTTIRDTDVLGVLVFLERLELSKTTAAAAAGHSSTSCDEASSASQPSGAPSVL
jgi:hypothetical protein